MDYDQFKYQQCPGCRSFFGNENSEEYEGDITVIPPEIFDEIFQYLSLEEIFKLCDKGLSGRLRCDKNFWKNLARRGDVSIGSIGEIFLAAVEGGYFNVVDSILKIDNIVNFKIGSFGGPALVIAVHENNLKMVDKLLQVQGVDVNLKDFDGDTALMVAAFKGYVEIVNRLLEADEINVNLQTDDNHYLDNEGGDTALIMAVNDEIYDRNSSSESVVKRLLEEKDNDINLQNGIGWTALMYAARGTQRYGDNDMEDLEIVNLILKYKPDVNIQSYIYEKTALMSSGSAAIINSLLEVDEININLQDFLGDTALMRSIVTHLPNEKYQKQALEKVKRLLKDKNIDVNLQNFDGDTPLMVAVEENNLDMVNALLQHPQINVNLRNNEGLTAFMIAMEKTQFKWGMTTNIPIVKRLLEVVSIKGNLKNFRIGLLRILDSSCFK